MLVAFYGDSITEDADGEYIKEAFPNYLKKWLGFDLLNRGVRGETINQICKRLKNDDLYGIDVLVISGGTNNFLNDEPVDELDFCLTMYYLKHKYPAIDVILAAPPKSWRLVEDAVIVMPKIDVFEKAAKEFDFKFVDLYNKSGLDLNNRRFYYCECWKDGNAIVHPNEMGHELLAMSIYKELEQCLLQTAR